MIKIVSLCLLLLVLIVLNSFFYVKEQNKAQVLQDENKRLYSIIDSLNKCNSPQYKIFLNTK